jgi:endonuclease/exonuclease/phosphatase family metal-dependent hydrolase
VIRVVTYNVSGGLDLGAAGEVLARLAPALVCVVERPSTGRLGRLARHAGLEVAVRAGRRGSGTAVLVHPEVRIRSTSTTTLSAPPDVPRREVAQAIVSAGGLRLSVSAVQLGLRPEVRRTNLEELLGFLDSIDAPTVLGCDLNESVRSPVAAALAERYQDGFAVGGTGAGATYPTTDPSTRQDFVFVDRSLTVLGATVPDTGAVAVASHHRPVVVDLAGREDDATRLPTDRDQAPRRRIA